MAELTIVGLGPARSEMITMEARCLAASALWRIRVYGLAHARRCAGVGAGDPRFDLWTT